MSSRSFALFCLGSVLALAPASLRAQEILVQVMASESQEPIPTAFISLVDEGGESLLHALTNPEGRALFSALEPGTYRLKAETFGRATAWSPPIHVAAGETESYMFSLVVEAIPLPALLVEAERQCQIRPQDGGEISRVWEEIRKALSIQRWTDEVGSYRFRILGWDRDLSPRDRSVDSETVRQFTTTARNPIQSLPVEDLTSGGFIQTLEGGRVEYFGPDASILLSDLFLNSHCFRLVEERDRHQDIGLFFEPVGTHIPDIEGTLWLDRETAHLQSLEFEYVNAPDRLIEGVGRGSVEFDRLPDGVWFVRRWWIQVPNVGYSLVNGRRRLEGIHETGQEVVEISPVSAVISPSPVLQTPGEPRQGRDTAQALHRAQELVREHYDVSRRSSSQWGREACIGVSLKDCMEGDWSCEDFWCEPIQVELRPLLIQRLEGLAPVAGNSEWLFRQRVGYAIKNGELERARTIARACDGGEAWCMTLRGLTEHLLHQGGGMAQFDSAFALMASHPRNNPSGEYAWGAGPDALCQWSDIPAVVPLALRDEVLASPCPEGQEVRKKFWWLTDPLWTREGNGRYVEHLARQVMIRMDLDILQVFDAAEEEPVYEDWMWESVNVHEAYGYAVRQGFPNSNTDPRTETRPTRDPGSRVVSVRRLLSPSIPYINGGYTFAPDANVFWTPLESTAEDWAVELGGRGCIAPWTLAACGPERMITRERWHNLDHQAVVLRRGGQLFFISAARIPEEVTPLDGLQAALALGRPADLEVEIVPAIIDEGRAFRASSRVDTAAYLASIEVVGPENIGRARFGASAPILTDGFGVSALALLDPRFESDSLSLEEALLPSLDLPEGGHVGLYFEVYGLGEEEGLEFTLTSEKGNASFFHRLARFLRLTSVETPRELAWIDPGEEHPGITRRFFDFNLSNLDGGEYTLTLKVKAGEEKEATVSTEIRVR